MAEWAEQVARELKEEDGVHREIEEFWEDAVISGTFQQEFLGKVQSSSRARLAIVVRVVSVMASLVFFRRNM